MTEGKVTFSFNLLLVLSVNVFECYLSLSASGVPVKEGLMTSIVCPHSLGAWGREWGNALIVPQCVTQFHNISNVF